MHCSFLKKKKWKSHTTNLKCEEKKTRIMKKKRSRKYDAVAEDGVSYLRTVRSAVISRTSAAESLAPFFLTNFSLPFFLIACCLFFFSCRCPVRRSRGCGANAVEGVLTRTCGWTQPIRSIFALTTLRLADSIDICSNHPKACRFDRSLL